MTPELLEVLRDRALQLGSASHDGMTVTVYARKKGAPEGVTVMGAERPETLPGWRTIPIAGGYIAVRGEWDYELEPGDFVSNQVERKFYVEIDADRRWLRAVALVDGGYPIEWAYRHQIALSVPAGIRADEFAEEMALEIDLEAIAARWQGIEHNGQNRVGMWAFAEDDDEIENFDELVYDLQETVDDICGRLARYGMTAETCEQRIERWRQTMRTTELLDMLVNHPGVLGEQHADEPYLVDPENAETIEAAFLAAYLPPLDGDDE